MITTNALHYPANGSRHGGQPATDWARRRRDLNVPNVNAQLLCATPAEAVTRCARSWDGIKVEIIQSVTNDKIEFRYRAPWHLLLAYEEGVRDEGETVIGDLPGSSLRSLRRKLTLVPAGHEFREWQRPRTGTRVVCFYFDPAKMPIDPAGRSDAAPLGAHLFFENDVLWETAIKLATAIGDSFESDRYCEALAVVVAHELLLTGYRARVEPRLARGGLAGWQQRIVASYVEEHLAEPIALAALAKLVGLSPFHFCRAFKQSFGVPPRRYHSNRRMERAKALLANPARSVTEIGLALGFRETSSFSTAFRHTTGNAPTEYRRAVC